MFNSYEIFLRGVPGINTFKFPVNPIGAFSISVRNKYETVDVFELGEVLLKRNKTLQEFGWRSLFPANEVERMVLGNDNENERTPIENIEILKNLKNELLYLIINIKDENGDIETYINEPVMFKELSTEDKGGEPGDIYYTIKFVQNIIPTIKKREIIPPTPTTPAFIPKTGGGGGGNQNPVPANKYNIGDIIDITGDTYEKINLQHEFLIESTELSNLKNSTKAYKYIQDPKSAASKVLKLEKARGTIKKIDEGIDTGWGHYDAQQEALKKMTIEKFYYVELNNPINKITNVFNAIAGVGGVIINMIKEIGTINENNASQKSKDAAMKAMSISHVYIKESVIEKKVGSKTGASYGGRSTN